MKGHWALWEAEAPQKPAMEDPKAVELLIIASAQSSSRNGATERTRVRVVSASRARSCKGHHP